MATIIDSLIVTLGLDSKDMDKKVPGVTKGLKGIEDAGKKTEEGIKKVSKTSKEAATSFEGVAKAAAGFLAVIGGTMAIKAFISDFIEANAALNRLSKNLGMGVSTISAWGQASEQLGGSAAGLQGTLKMLSNAQTDLMLTGQSSLIPYFSTLGVSMADAGGKARPVTDMLLDLADRFSHMDRTTANNMGQMMGIDQGTMNLLLQGRKELELTIKRQKESTAVTKAQAEEASKLQTSIAKSKQGFEAFGRSLLMSAAPAIEAILNGLMKLGAWVQANGQFIGDFLKIMAVGLGAIALVTMPINLTVVAVLALAAGIALLWQDYQTWKKGGDSLIDWGKWEPGITAATKAIQFLGDVAKSTWDKLKGGAGALEGFMLKHGYETAHIFDTVHGPKQSGASPTSNNTTSVAKAVEQLEGYNAKGGKPNRPQRNNNPGDIEYGTFAKAHGATGSDGRFAIFPSYDAGHQALISLLKTPGYANLSIADAVARFAPPNENNTAAYTNSVSKLTGLRSTDRVGGNGNTVTVGTINVQTAATDAPAIAKDIGKSMNYLFVSQVNPGLF